MEFTQIVRCLIFGLSLLSMATVTGCATRAKNQMTAGDSVSHEFRDNVVRIRAYWKDGTTTNEGFGFIVGERANQLYVATANHVLRDIDKPSPIAIAEKIEVIYFFQPDRLYSAQLLGVSDRSHDLGAIVVEKPQGLSWRKDVISTSRAERGAQVRFVGKLGEWEIPAAAGVVKGQETPWFLVEDLEVLRGTSGAPLLTDRGLVGMVISDGARGTRGLPIQAVADILQNHVPWQLSTREVIQTSEIPNWLKIAGGVLGAVAVGALIAGSGSSGNDGSEQPPGTVDVTAPTP